MNLKHTLISALDSILAHKLRSFLTILGVLIGVASIISVVSMGEGATDLILSEVEQMGAKTVLVIPSTGSMDITDVMYAELLTENDLDAIKRSANVPNLEDVMPLVWVSGKLKHRDKTYRSAMTIGASAEFFSRTFEIHPDQGRNFTDFEINSRSRSAVIGHRVAEELFERVDVVGESILIDNSRFRIVGVYPKVGQKGMFDIDDLVIIPYTSAQSYLLGHNDFDRFIVRADSVENINKVKFDITNTLRETRQINEENEEDFIVMTQQGLRDQIDTILNILTNFLAFVVSIALLVGGIGIMNIMLVSVTERTREIGLRKALGATPSAILKQFAWEAIILTMVGGFLGIIFGALISFLTSFVLTHYFDMNWTFSFPLSAAFLGLVVSATVGIIFGFYPAKKAADLSPVEALQYE
ncbi:MAG: ABC transporter permease [Candidatus Paceibacterota bacterium]